MPLGYDYVATQDLRINNVPAFHTGQLVPDATASAQGWIATGQVVPVGSVVPGPTGNVPVSPTAPDPVVFPIWADSTTSPPTLRGWNGTAWVTYVNAVSSVNGHTGTVVLTATDVGSIPTSQKGAASGVAQLDSSGKLLAAELPALAINQTFVVASQAAMLALAGDVGDTAVRTDTSTTFILAALPASTLANWTQLLSPASPVSSVAGRTGAVTLSVGDVTNAVATTDSRLSDARTPTAHKTSHQSGGSDALSLDASQIGTGQFAMARLATGTPNGTQFIRDDGSLATPTGSSGNSFLGFYGDGSDGNVTISTAVTLTRDMYYDTLTIASGGVLTASKYRVYCRTACLVNTGGSLNVDGVPGVTVSGGVAPLQTSGCTIGVGTSGGANSTVGSNGVTSAVFMGGIGGGGGSGTGVGTGAAGGIPSTPPTSAVLTSVRAMPMAGLGWAYVTAAASPFTPAVALVYGGTGGGGGSSSGGGGGAGGNVLVLNARTIANNGTISANGGAGAAGTATNSGGGGGGGGGLVIVNTSQAVTGSAPTANGGAGGAKTGTFFNGATGAAGTVLVNVWN